VTAAIFGLVGVVIGALITGGTNYALQVRAERRELRAAARMMLQELSNTSAALGFAVEHDQRGILEHALDESQWTPHHLLLARHLPDDDRDVVALAYGEAATAALMSEGDPATQWRAEVREILARVEEGCRVLRARAHRGGWSPPEP
jgi:hypothetical protein